MKVKVAHRMEVLHRLGSQPWFRAAVRDSSHKHVVQQAPVRATTGTRFSSATGRRTWQQGLAGRMASG